MPLGSDNAFAAAYMAAACAAVLALLRHESGADPEIGALAIEVNTSGEVAVTFMDRAGTPVGGYTL